MSRLLLIHVPALALLAACGGGGAPDPAGATVRGALRADPLAADGDTLYVRVAGDSERVPVLGGAFVLPGVGPGPATLRFARGADSVARMEVGELPEGASLELRGIRLDGASGLAFPASVGLDGAATVTVNGLRYAARPLPAQLRADGTVLAVSDAGDALLVRPADGSLPDLRVVVGPLTETATPDGDPVPAGELARGDSVRVEGRTDGPYVVASRIVAPRSLALREAGEDAGGAGDGGARSGATPPAAAAAASGQGGGESGEVSTGRDDSRGRDEARGRDEGRGRERKDDKPGRGKGRGRGRE
jgi:hypothetical protein